MAHRVPRRAAHVLFPCLVGLVGLVALSSACGSDPPPPPATPPAPSSAPAPAPIPTPLPRATRDVPMAPTDVDPVAVGLSGPDGITRVCDESLARARAVLGSMRAAAERPDAELTWDTTVGKLDRARIAIRNAGDFPGLMAVAHPDAAVRDKAKACEPKIDELETSLWLDAKIASVVKRFAALQKDPLPPAHARLLEHTLRDFRRNGLDLDEKGQARLRELNERITKLGQDFDSNLAASRLTVQAKPADLDGLPKEWLAAHPPGKDGLVELTTDYPDYFPVLTYAKNRDVALALYKQFENRAADKNVAVLDEILKLRAEKAKLLGYATWADYVIEPRMAKDAKTVAGFLDGLKKHLAKKGETELAEFKAMHTKLGGKPGPLSPHDRLYLEDQVRKAKYGLDSKEVSQYFEVTHVKEGLLAITSRLFGIKYRKAENAPTWHPDVEAMEITDANGKLLGRFWFDLYPR
ncbi:MAG: oligopeptidase A, partial [Deltaproteobacteria bacterium]|nr:oligopeptidase A [Deltaproteobacteria bacterium]